MSCDSRKFVVVSCEGGDFSMDLVFAGLVKLYGRKRVIDWPHQRKFHQGKPVLVGDDEKDYGAERRSLSYVDVDYVTFEECVGMRHFAFEDDVIVFMDETEESRAAFCQLKISRRGKSTPVVVVAGHDRFRGDPKVVAAQLGRDLIMMFIDDWQPEYDELPYARLINLSCNFDHLWDSSRRQELLADKKYDICFYGYNSNPVRKVVIDHVKRKWGFLDNAIAFEERPDTFSSFVRHDELFRTMAQSRICLNLPGASTGGRALRYYEIPYVGSYMLSMEFKAKLLSPFEGGVHCSYFGSLPELDECIRRALGDPDWREGIATMGHRHCMAEHTVEARMRYMMGTIDGQV